MGESKLGIELSIEFIQYNSMHMTAKLWHPQKTVRSRAAVADAIGGAAMPGGNGSSSADGILVRHGRQAKDSHFRQQARTRPCQTQKICGASLPANTNNGAKQASKCE